MAFDGGFLYKTVDELKEAIDCHIDKIYQPTRDELVFLLRKKGFVKKLLITVKPGSSRIHFTENKYENPSVPPNFCMLLRKHLSSARLTDITQTGLERVAELIFSATNEMGDSVTLRLICELIGNQANVVLVKSDGKIIDAMRHSDVETAKRLILPGAEYEYPPAQRKENPLLCDMNSFVKQISDTDGDISKVLLNAFDGFSPLICREIQYKAENLVSMGKSRAEAVNTALSSVKNCLSSPSILCIVFKPDGMPFEFSYTDISQYGEGFKKQSFDSCSALLDTFYTARDNAARIQSSAHDIIRLISNLKSRTEKKLALRLDEIKACENRDTLRIYGELLKANLYNIENGSSFAEVQNYYDENLSKIRIPLNPALSPSKNAEKYFKDYKKTYTAEQTLTALTEIDRQELAYFDSVLDSISRCSTLSELGEIRQELTEAGYIKRTSFPKKAKPTQNNFKEYQSREGYRILVGKNNMQNDYITTHLASKNDLWFHVKNIPGSHVVVFSQGNDVSDETVFQAALLAARNSKAADSAQVPVDYTVIKNVKKPSGAKPGMVIYTTNKTVFINPSDSSV